MILYSFYQDIDVALLVGRPPSKGAKEPRTADVPGLAELRDATPKRPQDVSTHPFASLALSAQIISDDIVNAAAEVVPSCCHG